MSNIDRQSGLTLVETLVVIALVAIIAAAAMPSLQGLVERQHLRAAADELYTQLLSARLEAIRRHRPVSVSLTIDEAAGRWCLALHDDGACDCFTGDDCRLDDVPQRITRGDDYGPVGVSTSFAAGDLVTFHPPRGTANPGTLTVTAGGRAAGIRVSSLGRARLCSGDLPGYPSC